MSKKRKGGSTKGPSPERVVVSATTRRPGEGTIEENELGQLPAPGARAAGTGGEPSRGLPNSGPGVGKEEPRPPRGLRTIQFNCPHRCCCQRQHRLIRTRSARQDLPRLAVLVGSMTLHRPQYDYLTMNAGCTMMTYALFRSGIEAIQQ